MSRITVRQLGFALGGELVKRRAGVDMVHVPYKGTGALLPDVPTVAESGLPDFEVLGWFALLAPAGTPQEILKLLDAEVNKLVAKPALVQRFAELGAEPLGGTPNQAAAFIRGEQDKWGKVTRDAGIKVQ